MTIIVTDSGIGGYSVAAELFARLKARSLSARIIFFNALFDENSGYNRLKSLSEKVEKFDMALQGMMKLTPDAICVACNTLSVIYPHTAFAQAAPMRVTGIVEVGVDALLRRMASVSQPCAVLFATPTTIQQGEHARRLRQLRPDAQLVEQPCPELIKAIEDGKSPEIEVRIREYVAAAVAQIPTRTGAAFAGLFCTHFGYFREIFQRVFLEFGINASIVNPNSALVENMVEMLAEQSQNERIGELSDTFKVSDNLYDYSISLECVSKTPISAAAINTLAPLLRVYGDEAVAALQAYRHIPELF
ncbi:glutamate racemase [Candidatus Moduliflexus flocculans]|uniref:Glutamate racemase n=1 Tax=Candidatus Moduliflexus flocculans TaxID=1499966 RepID=A0A081BTH6_9BACT|nr:glutamate racemase [Candidatus Moduliflexus flocculans]